MTPEAVKAVLLDSDAKIAARAVADLCAAARDWASQSPAPQRTHPFVRARAAIRDYQERVTGGAWPHYFDRAAVREIAKAGDVPRDIVRHVLRYPDHRLGEPQ